MKFNEEWKTPQDKLTAELKHMEETNGAEACQMQRQIVLRIIATCNEDEAFAALVMQPHKEFSRCIDKLYKNVEETIKKKTGTVVCAVEEETVYGICHEFYRSDDLAEYIEEQEQARKRAETEKAAEEKRKAAEEKRKAAEAKRKAKEQAAKEPSLLSVLETETETPSTGANAVPAVFKKPQPSKPVNEQLTFCF